MNLEDAIKINGKATNMTDKNVYVTKNDERDIVNEIGDYVMFDIIHFDDNWKPYEGKTMYNEKYMFKGEVYMKVDDVKDYIKKYCLGLDEKDYKRAEVIFGKEILQ